MYGDTAEKYDKIFRFNPDVVRLIEEYLPAGERDILDIGCGTGKYAGKLAERHRVVGIDTDARSIDIAGEKYPDAEFVNTDLPSYRSARKFDLVYCIGNVISHVLKTDLDRFIQCVGSNLAVSGVWLFHTMNWDRIITMDKYDFPVLENESARFVRAYRNISGERVDFITALSDESGAAIENCITLYPQTAADIEKLHGGFERLAVFGNYRKDPLRPDDISRVYVFRKVGV